MLPYLLTGTDPPRYAAYLERKLAEAYRAFHEAALPLGEVQVWPSAPRHYRMRTEFEIVHREGTYDYAMFMPGTSRLIITNHPDLHARSIDELMDPLRQAVCAAPSLRERLFGVEFLANQGGEVVAALHYHKMLGEDLAQALRQARRQLQDAGLRVELCARARGQLLAAERSELTETYALPGGGVHLIQVIGTFSQPNAGVCTRMLEFARGCAEQASAGARGDLLELYCGSGTFTVALAPCFRQVLATEVSRTAARTVRRNLQVNDIANATIIRLSAAEVSQALQRRRTFRRLEEQGINLPDWRFAAILLDPPRQGIGDEATLQLAARFEHIIYVSCSLPSLLADLQQLRGSHAIVRAGFFDQFPYTPHLESIIHLVRRDKAMHGTPPAVTDHPSPGR